VIQLYQTKLGFIHMRLLVMLLVQKLFLIL